MFEINWTYSPARLTPAAVGETSEIIWRLSYGDHPLNMRVGCCGAPVPDPRYDDFISSFGNEQAEEAEKNVFQTSFSQSKRVHK